jgi:polysaccharide chain length determinant protein (PEP-CTERM system associated)
MSAMSAETAKHAIDYPALILAAAWRRRSLILAPLAVLPVLGVVVGLIAPKTYETRMSILVQELNTNPVVQDLSVATNLKDRMDGLIVLLKSRHVLGEIVEKFEMIPKGSSDALREEAVKALAARLNVILVGRDLIELKLRSARPDMSRDLLETIGVRFVDVIRAPAQSSIAGSETFLRDKIAEERKSLETAEQALAEFRAQNADRLPELHAANVTRLSQMRDQLQEKTIALAGAAAASDSLRDRLVQANPVIGKLEEQIVQLRGELATLRARYTDEHSAVQGLVRRLERLDSERAHEIEEARQLTSGDLEALWNRAASLQSDPSNHAQPLLVSQLAQLQEAESSRQSLTREIESLKAVVADLEQKVSSYGEVDRQQQTLERDVQMQRELYDSLVKRFETARLTVDLGRFELPEQIKLIERPGVPVTVSPPLLVFAIAGLFAALFAGAGLAVIAELLDRSLHTVGAFEKLLRQPVVAIAPVLIEDGLAGFSAALMTSASQGAST